MSNECLGKMVSGTTNPQALILELSRNKRTPAASETGHHKESRLRPADLWKCGGVGLLISAGLPLLWVFPKVLRLLLHTRPPRIVSFQVPGEVAAIIRGRIKPSSVIYSPLGFTGYPFSPIGQRREQHVYLFLGCVDQNASP